MSTQNGQSINQTAQAFIDTVGDYLAINVANPNSDRQIVINQITFGLNINTIGVGLSVLQNAEPRGAVYGVTSPLAIDIAGIGEYIFFDYIPATSLQGGKTINFISRPLICDPATNCLIVVYPDFTAGNCRPWVTVLGDYVPTRSQGKIGNLTLR